MQSWGKELILNCSNCNLDKMTNKEHIEKFAKQLVATIDMVSYGEPWIVDFGSGDKAGYTLIQLIETSNISAHFANESRAIYFNCFSCKDFDENKAIDVVVNYFEPTHVEDTVLYRNA